MGRIFEDNEFSEKENRFLSKYKNRLMAPALQQELVKEVQGLLNNTKPNPKKLFVVEGIWALKKAQSYELQIDSFAFCPEFIFSTESEKIVDDFIKLADNSYMVSRKLFLKMSERESPDGLLALCRLPQFSFQDIKLKENNLVVILDGLEIPGNIGTIIRSVDGVGADGVILCNRKARLTHPKLIKSSQGSNFTIPIVESELTEAMEWLKDNGFKIYLTDTRAEQEYFEPDYKGRVAIVAGSERYGMSREWYTPECNMISIPMYGDCDSLNVAIATTIVLYEASLKQKGKIKR